MPSFRKIFLIAGCLTAVAIAVAKEKDEKGRPDAKQKNGESKDGKRGEEAAKPVEKMPFPLPIGHGGKGLKIPYLDGDARKTMNFVVGSAQRIDADQVKMSKLKIEMYDDEAKPEMTIDLPNSTLNLNTRVITAEKKVKIKRDDFELTGDGMKFDTVTKQGTLKGNVRMLIYNLANEIESDAPTKPAGKRQPTDKRKPSE